MIDNVVDKYLNETSLSRIYRQMQDFDSGIITAFRYAEDCGTGHVYTRKENLQRNKSLLAKLSRQGYSVTSVKGTYIENYRSKDAVEVGENAFLVVDISDGGRLERDLRALGKEFDQDSILFVPKGGKEGQLIGTNTCPSGYPGYNKVNKFKNPVFGEKGEFFTRVNGRPFILKESAKFYPVPKGWFGLMGCAAVAKTPWQDLEIDND